MDASYPSDVRSWETLNNKKKKNKSRKEEDLAKTKATLDLYKLIETEKNVREAELILKNRYYSLKFPLLFWKIFKYKRQKREIIKSLETLENYRKDLNEQINYLGKRSWNPMLPHPFYPIYIPKSSTSSIIC